MLHFLVVTCFSALLGWMAGSPAIGCIVWFVEVFVALRHAKDLHPETPMGRFGREIPPQAITFVMMIILLGVNRMDEFVGSLTFWVVSVALGTLVFVGSRSWHRSVHPTLPAGRSRDNEVFAQRVIIFVCVALAVLIALFAHNFPLHASAL